MNEHTFTIKLTEDLIDLSGDNPDFIVPAGTVLTDAQDEGEYFIVDFNGESFPVMKDECEVLP